jgi:hypothetical protein
VHIAGSSRLPGPPRPGYGLPPPAQSPPPAGHRPNNHPPLPTALIAPGRSGKGAEKWADETAREQQKEKRNAAG